MKLRPEAETLGARCEKERIKLLQTAHAMKNWSEVRKLYQEQSRLKGPLARPHFDGIANHRPAVNAVSNFPGATEMPKYS